MQGIYKDVYLQTKEELYATDCIFHSSNNYTDNAMKYRSLLLLAFLGVWMNAVAADPVKGDGKVATRTIEVDDYNEIRINGVMEFNYTQTEVPSGVVEITLDENLYQYLQTEVKNRVLSISFKGAKVDQVTRFVVKADSKWLKEARVEGNANMILHTPLTGDELEVRANANSLVQLKEPVTTGSLRLKITGSGNIVADRIETEKLVCDLDGSGSITLKNGKAPKGEYSIVGGSDLHAYGMEVADLSCKMTGSGLAEITATTNLRASIMGKGNIRYKGDAAVQQQIIGKGTIENTNTK